MKTLCHKVIVYTIDKNNIEKFNSDRKNLGKLTASLEGYISQKHFESADQPDTRMDEVVFENKEFAEKGFQKLLTSNETEGFRSCITQIISSQRFLRNENNEMTSA